LLLQEVNNELNKEEKQLKLQNLDGYKSTEDFGFRILWR